MVWGGNEGILDLNSHVLVFILAKVILIKSNLYPTVVHPGGCLLLTYPTILLPAAQIPITAGIVFAVENILFFADRSRTPGKSQASESRWIFEPCGYMTENNEDVLWRF